MSVQTLTARPLAPEDIEVQSYVAVLHEVREWMPVWLAEGLSDIDRLRPLRWLATPDGRMKPLRVVGVCLPFVLVERPKGDHRTLDTRTVRLARLDTGFGAAAFELLRRDAQRKKDQESGDGDKSER